MFSTKQHLIKRTGACGIGRFNYLQSLIEEFQTTELSSSKREILANLANFAYDPINYDYFLQLNIPDIFIDCLVDEKDKDPCLRLYALTGVCNSCLDKRMKSFYISNGCVKAVAQYLFWDDPQMIIQAITSLMYLINNESRQEITAVAIRQRMVELMSSLDRRVKNLATVFVEDYLPK
ncbi:ARMC7 [Bugula neritina]|uniref:ARMC7 n=1 Tax=Bugula neritina TaxID=10212 RepID=A0A7J7JJJ7_BUGNE|nr:ARMC7 [Bugula neritina]